MICSKCKIDKCYDDFNKNQKYCRTCQSICKKVWHEANKLKANACSKRYDEEHKEEKAKRMKEWSVANRDRINTKKQEANAKNPSKNRQRVKEWKKSNPDKVKILRAAYEEKYPYKKQFRKRLREASQLTALPTWANKFFMSEIYSLAKLRSKYTGIVWHVDHIVPLRSRFVCGLHVEHNMQIIPATANLKKGNRYWPDMSTLA